MASKRRQINIRLNDDEFTRLDALTERVRAVTNLTLQQADVYRIGLAELEKRYPAEQPQKRSKP